MNNYSFEQQPKSYASTRPFNVSDARAKYYYDLCTQRGIQGINIYTITTNEEFDAELNRVRSFRRPSEAQLKLIETKVANLASMQVEVAIPDNLTGGMDGTAGKFIQLLIELEKEHYDEAKPTESQLQAIVGYYLCPDVAFEDHNISRRIEMDTFPGAWRRPTPQEFAEQIKANMSRKEASAFIDKFRGVFYEWNKTRIRPEQIKMIRTLEERFKSPNGRIFESAVTIGGQAFTYTTEKHEAPVVEYVTLEELQIRMMSVEDASTFISMLKAELGAKELYQFGEVADSSATFEGLRNNKKTVLESKESELADLVRICFKLEAVAGYKLPELHDLIDELTVEYDGGSDVKRTAIREIFLSLVDDGSITLGGLADLFNDNKTAMAILLAR